MKLKVADWQINSNGAQGVLSIKEIDSSGRIINSSTVFGNQLVGVWDDDARRITFLRIIKPNDPSSIQLYTGCLLDGQDTLTGTFMAFAGSGGKAQRSEFGWFAKI